MSVGHFGSEHKSVRDRFTRWLLFRDFGHLAQSAPNLIKVRTSERLVLQYQTSEEGFPSLTRNAHYANPAVGQRLCLGVLEDAGHEA